MRFGGWKVNIHVRRPIIAEGALNGDVLDGDQGEYLERENASRDQLSLLLS